MLTFIGYASGSLLLAMLPESNPYTRQPEKAGADWTKCLHSMFKLRRIHSPPDPLKRVFQESHDFWLPTVLIGLKSNTSKLWLRNGQLLVVEGIKVFSGSQRSPILHGDYAKKGTGEHLTM